MKLRRNSSTRNVSGSSGSGSGGSWNAIADFFLTRPVASSSTQASVHATAAPGRSPMCAAIVSGIAAARGHRCRGWQTSGACASEIPRLRAAPVPGSRLRRTTRMRGSANASATSAVPSREPSSTTISSQSERVWHRTDSIASPIVAALLYAAMTTLNVGGDGTRSTAPPEVVSYFGARFHRPVAERSVTRPYVMLCTWRTGMRDCPHRLPQLASPGLVRLWSQVSVTARTLCAWRLEAS